MIEPKFTDAQIKAHIDFANHLEKEARVLQNDWIPIVNGAVASIRLLAAELKAARQSEVGNEHYRKKYPEVHAVQFNQSMLRGDENLPEGIERKGTEMSCYVDTPKVRVFLKVSDWVVTDNFGDRAILSPSLFEKTYCPARDSQSEVGDAGSKDSELPGMWSESDFKGGDPDERSYAERARVATESGEANPPVVTVAKNVADNYCHILSLLGMEKGGNPVSEVHRLLSISKRAAELLAEIKSTKDLLAPHFRNVDPMPGDWMIGVSRIVTLYGYARDVVAQLKSAAETPPHPAVVSEVTAEEMDRCEKVLTSCICIPDFKDRNMVDPNCAACDIGDEVIDTFRAMRNALTGAAIRGQK